MRFMYQYPDLTGLEGDMLDSGPVAELARTAEDAGWDGFSFTEHPAPGLRWLQTGGHQTLDPFVALGYVAAVTSRLKLLTYLSVLPYRNPMLLAKAAASVDILSGGRFILGAGTGYNKSEFHALGVDFDERNTLFDEALDVLPKHWSGEPFSYAGQHFSAREVIARPRPPQQPIPIWIGGNSKLTRRRVVQRANGWMPMFGPESLFATTRTPSISAGDELTAAIAPPFVAEFAPLAERHGYAGIAFTDHPAPTVRWTAAGGEGSADPLVSLAYCAAVTSSIELMTFVLALPYHNPFRLAHQAATLDALSGGRLTLGLGTGYLRGEMRALGASPDSRLTSFDAVLETMVTAWSAESVSGSFPAPESTLASAPVSASAAVTSSGPVSGSPADPFSGWSAREVHVQPRPLQRPHPPLWFHGNSAFGRARAARYGGGSLGV